MPIFTDSYLNELIEEAEKVISERLSIIFNRFTLAITAGTSTYTLPNNVHRVLGITWKGADLDPREWQDYQEDAWIRPQDLGRSGLPNTYLRVGYGWNKVMFYPIPDDSITADDTDINLTTVIKEKVIVTCFRIADISTEDQRLPRYMFRNIMKYYAMSRAYAKEGPGQNLQASQYFEKKYFNFLRVYEEIIGNLQKNVYIGFGPSDNFLNTKPARPQLPTSGKWSF